jgi:hypothetical protein
MISTPLWEETPSGILIPVQQRREYSRAQQVTYETLAARALDVEAMYSRYGVSLSTSCDLVRLMADVRVLNRAWIENRRQHCTRHLLYQASHFERVSSALLRDRGAGVPIRLLRDLTKGSLDLFKRVRSKARDALWELELARFLDDVGLRPRFGEPDLLIDSDVGPLGFACKRIYSEKNLSKTLSTGVAQIKGSTEDGLLALCLDDRLPADHYILAEDIQEAIDGVQQINWAFLERHERKFSRYLASGRSIAAFVSTTCVVEVRTGGINSFQQALLWVIPGLPESKMQALEPLRRIFPEWRATPKPGN